MSRVIGEGTDTNDTSTVEAIGELHKKLVEIENLIEDNAANSKRLIDSFAALGKLVDGSVQKVADTRGTVKSIQDIAMNTRILGFNASIEASRAKESGKGFGVIAQEVRSLAEVSTTSTNRIEEIIQAIGADTEEIADAIQRTEETIKLNIEGNEQISALFKEVSALASILK